MLAKPKSPAKKAAAGHAEPAPADRARSAQRIVLTGFMGSGKTTVGSLLAERLGWAFLDLDREIERRDGRTVPQIFASTGETGGEAHFRRLESATLAELLGQPNAVIALGGGAPEDPANRTLLQHTSRTAVIYLAASFDLLVARCSEQAALAGTTPRPVFADLASAERRFHLRRPLYERIASHTLDTSALTPAEASSTILELLREAG